MSSTKTFLLAAVICLAVGILPASASTLYGLSSSIPGTVYTIDPATGVATPLVDLTGVSDTSLVGLEFYNGQLYATDVSTTEFSFGTIDLITGAFTALNNQGGSSNWHSLALNTALALFYTYDFNNDDLRSVSADGLTITSLGDPGVGIVGLAYDDINAILYGYDGTNLYTLNTTNGAATLIGSTGVADSGGLAYDSILGILYLNAGTGGALYTLDTSTGAATLVGLNGVAGNPEIDGLAFDAGTTVPEPSSLALMALGAVVLGLRRWRSASR